MAQEDTMVENRIKPTWLRYELEAKTGAKRQRAMAIY